MRSIAWLVLSGSFLAACTRLSGPAMPPSPEDRQREFVHCFRQEMKPTEDQLKAIEGRILVASPETRGFADELRRATDALEKQLENPAAGDRACATFAASPA